MLTTVFVAAIIAIWSGASIYAAYVVGQMIADADADEGVGG